MVGVPLKASTQDRWLADGLLPGLLAGWQAEWWAGWRADYMASRLITFLGWLSNLLAGWLLV